jgi:signal transduction histidine kinase/CheY-like chemotaxis protein
MPKTNEVTTGDLTYLRRESLQTVLLCLAVVLYIWWLILFRPIQDLDSTAGGIVLLALGLTIGFVFKQRNLTLAATATIVSVALFIFLHMWLLDNKVAPYFLAVVVSLTGLMFGMKTVMVVTVLCSASIIATGTLRWGHSPLSSELVSPMLLIGAVGILSSLAVRNLYVALDWALDRAMEAQRNQDELRERRAELVRTLKALDIAYQRLEYLNYDLARAREAAEEARLVKQQFVTRVSHELRTPLNVIIALSETLYLSPERYGAGPLPPAFRGDVREIYRNSKHLLQLINDVLDMSQIEARRMRIELRPVALRDVIVEAVEMIRPLVREKEVALIVDLPDDLPPICVDRNRVQQVLLNLLNNARRFTEHGSITVRAILTAEGVQVTVADTGVGIPPDEITSMFKEFHQLDRAVPHQEGSGLGLAISKRFIEMHGGRIWAESDGVPGHGSRFHFTLPLTAVELTEPADWQAPRPSPQFPTGRGRTLLILDHDPTVVRMLEQGLEEYQVVPVDDVADVPQLVEQSHARAVLLNSVRRGRVGRQMQELRQVLGRSSLPIILCPLVGEQQLGESLGVVDYLVKPITRDVLMALLNRFGDGVRRILVTDDDPRMMHLLSRLLQTAEREYQVIGAHNGKECLRAMRHQRPDLVLLDLVMPEMDGYTVLAQMREDAELRHIPVVIVTAQTRTPEVERQLGGRTLVVSQGAGFTNEQVINYLRSILAVASLPSSPSSVGEVLQRG